LQISRKVGIYEEVFMNNIISFTKVSGAGNDFVLVDNMKGALDLNWPKVAIALCSRPFGIGGDGLLVLEKSLDEDFFMKYFNADGSYGGMCGNGGRCAARYAYLNGIAGASMTFRALGHVYKAEVRADCVVLRMNAPGETSRNMTIQSDERSFSGYFLDTGSPHFVLVCDSLEIDVAHIGRLIRTHSLFQPAGTNVDFVRIVDTRTLQIRTYERGVEAETLACGTGAVAAALIGALHCGQTQPIEVRTRSGESLLVSFRGEAGRYTEVALEGSAHILFSGNVLYDDLSDRLKEPMETAGRQAPLHLL
jgi:diaminopimelate epimerase